MSRPFRPFLLGTALLDKPAVAHRVIDPFDHEHLNCEGDFAGMNPTVENIAKVIWDKLHGKFGPAQRARA